MNVLERAAELADELTEAEIAATHVVHALAGQLPAVLVGPPTIDWSQGTVGGVEVTWSLTAIASTLDPDQAWEELQELIEAVTTVLDIEKATPAGYALTAGVDPFPAYALTYSEILER